MPRTFLLLAGAAMLLPAMARAAAPAFDPNRVSQDVKTLSSDAYEGRGPATPAEKKTVGFIVAQMKAAGLEPGGPLTDHVRSWTQDVPLLKTDIVGALKVSLTSAGTARPLTQGKEIAVRAALTGQTRVSIAQAPLVFVGYGVKAPERNWDDYKGVDLHGKIMVVLVNDPDFEGGEGDFGGKTMTYYGRWTYKYEEAARQGAAGVLVIHEYAPASYGWPTVKNSNTITNFDIVRADPKTAHTPMEGWIQRDLAADLFKAAGLDFDAMKKAAQPDRLEVATTAATTTVRGERRDERDFMCFPVHPAIADRPHRTGNAARGCGLPGCARCVRAARRCARRFR